MNSPETKEQPLSLRERAKRDKFRRIREATQTLLSDRSINEITMRDVAQLAEIGEATLFRYVAAKEDLLLLVFGNRMEELIGSIETDAAFAPHAGASGREIVDRVLQLYSVRAAFYLADPDNVTDYVRIGLAPGNALGGLSVDHGDRFIHVVELLLTAGQTGGALTSGWDPHIVAGNCHGLFIHEILRSPTRHFPPASFESRMEARLRAQLDPLIA